MLCAATLLTVLRRPDYAPRSTETFTLREKLYSLRLAGPLILVIASIIFGLYLGVFTPTEAGAVGAAVTLVLAVVRQLRLELLVSNDICPQKTQLFWPILDDLK